MELQVQHDKTAHKFFVLTDGKESVLEYSVLPDGKTLDYKRSFVPVELRGRGIAEIIVKFALDYAQKNGFKVVPTCPYVKVIIDRNPQYQTLVQPF